MKSLKHSKHAQNKKGHKTRRQLRAQEAAAAKRLVDDANAQINPLAALTFHTFTAKDESVMDVICSRVADLPEETLTWIFNLMERNMKEMYEQSSWGWDLVSKKQELTEPAAWYLVASSKDELLGFSHFRFDIDHGVEVLYCYELQLEPIARRKGLGQFLMQTLESMACHSQMQKVVLTVLKHNVTAIPFFHTLGYKLDNTSPPASEKVDYAILSKYV
ncbi:N-alpha-acetyltransferase 40 [Orussus abietinus]|uniref:N-alpha-acetyltransferase 40 n=1 Tax=Orussus abietinus TaxID=222816 RepID=UPI0006250DE2|nr:N-alpha-acetyltransferase 40 [Orussus abietinus]